MRTLLKPAVAVAIATGMVAGSIGLASAQVIEQVPPPRVEAPPPPPPAPNYLWEPGHWLWVDNHYDWVGGRYVMREPAWRGEFVPGHWTHRGTGWVWIPAHWS
jgi:hypothetical protein